MVRKGVAPGARRAFFISPIGAPGSAERVRSDVVLAHVLIPALVPEYVDHADNIERADKMHDPGEITPAIVEAIITADLVIADLTDANPNVYYEVAIAHAFARPVVHIIEEGQTPRFDVKDARAFPYGTRADLAAAAQVAIADAAAHALARGAQPTVVSRAAELRAIDQSGDPVAQQLANLAAEVSRLTRPAESAATAAARGTAQHWLSELSRAAQYALPVDGWQVEEVRKRLTDPSIAAIPWMDQYCAYLADVGWDDTETADFLLRGNPTLADLRRYATHARTKVDALSDSAPAFAAHYVRWLTHVAPRLKTSPPELP